MTDVRQVKCEILNGQVWYEKYKGPSWKACGRSAELVTNQLRKRIMDIDSSIEGSQAESVQREAAHRSMCNTARMDPKVPRIFGHVQLVPKVHYT